MKKKEIKTINDNKLYLELRQKFNEIGSSNYKPSIHAKTLCKIVRDSKNNLLKCDVEYVFIFDSYFSFITDEYSLSVKGGK